MERYIFRKLFFSGLVLWLIFPFTIQSQSVPVESDVSHSIFIMGVPQHLFNNGIRIETDWRIGQTNNWVTVAPVFYYRDQRGNQLWGNYDILSMNGGGLELFYRWYPQGINAGTGAYVSLGGGYQFVNQRFSGYRWEGFDENGLSFYRYDSSPWDRLSHSVALKGYAGYLVTANDYLGIDVFLGWGLKFSQQTVPTDVYYEQPNDVYSFGGSGFLFVGGIRVGVGW